MLALVFLVGFPIIELLLLIQAGSAFGFWPTVGIVLGTGALGIYLIREQGTAAIRSAQEDRATGEVPVGAILTGIRLAFAGLLLVIPGFITDAIGLLLLIPGVSGSVISVGERSGTFRFAESRSYHARHYGGGQDNVVEAEYEVVSDPEAPAPRQNNQSDPEQTIILPPPDKGGQRRNG